MSEISNEDAHQDLLQGIRRGNHKGATNQPKVLESLITKDVHHAFALPITIDTATKIKGARWAPLNIIDQWTIDAKGNRTPKHRLTHDQSFDGLTSGVSINDQVDHEKLEPLIYGFMFLRSLHMIHAMRLAHPHTPILLCKYDLDAAYRRLHMQATSAIKCICTTITCALIYLRLTFGGSFSPAEWCVIIELITDVANDITNNPHWSPDIAHAPTPDPTSIPSPLTFPADTPFAPALPVAVLIPLPLHGWVDSYIDDILGICLHIGDNAKRVSAAILLTIYLIAHPGSATDHPIPHNYMLSLKKWLAEGRQEESKTVLGWVVNTRSLLVSLPDDKFDAYKKQVQDIIRLKKADDKNLQCLIGRLERTAYAVPNAKFFINRLRHLQYVAEKTRWVTVPKATLEDLHLWVEFLEQAKKGTSINNLVFRRPSHFFWADSCPFGLGGYSARGRAWRFYIPPHLRTPHTNNVLEFMAIIITIWIDAIEGFIPPLSCLLGCSDSSSAVGWMHRSNFDPATKQTHEACSRHLARILLKQACTLFSQHQKGKHNIVADLLSRWHFLNPIELTLFLKHISYTQIPTNFTISPLPPVIVSWVTSTLGRLRDAMVSQKTPTKNTSERGNDGSPGWTEWASKTTPTYLGLNALQKPDWSAALLSASAEGNTVLPDTRHRWEQALLDRPSVTWRRPLRSTTTPTPAATTKVTSTLTSQTSYELSPEMTPSVNRKKQ